MVRCPYAGNALPGISVVPWFVNIAAFDFGKAIGRAQSESLARENGRLGSRGVWSYVDPEEAHACKNGEETKRRVGSHRESNVRAR